MNASTAPFLAPGSTLGPAWGGSGAGGLFAADASSWSNASMDSVQTSMSPEEVHEMIQRFLDQQLVYKEASHIVLIACYVPLFLVALFANCLVIFVVFKYHYMRR
ncbi:Orexin receptor type 1 [Frankliniella fusca]|uniref:Orexin receptor type 1 n=1 Tax=Frankliniella fusca TaxID=407009 RepID=A0AAE1LSG3_9NEOP|nr:Orexin receptor type 1 [Frankliniella fusca]